MALLNFYRQRIAELRPPAGENVNLPLGSLTDTPALYAQPRYGIVNGTMHVEILGESNAVGFSPTTLVREIATGERAWLSTGDVIDKGRDPLLTGTAARAQSPAPTPAAARARARRARAAAKPAAA